MSEFDEIEGLLTGHSTVEPSAALRERVLGRVRAELRRSSRRRSTGSLWRFSVATAAAAVLWINLSMSAANVTDWRFRPQAVCDLAETTRQLHELFPDMTDVEARGQALGLRGRLCLQQSARPTGTWGLQPEDATWDSH